MEIGREQVFNLWDTNGRRHDVINAIDIYLHILQDLFQRYPTEKWAAYPNSTLQYHFYKAAINASPEVFQSHQRFDDFEQFLSDKYFNLKQTSKTFYYIALAYIPIILLALIWQTIHSN